MNSNKTIQIQELSKAFYREKVLKQLSFDVFKGDLFAFLGANGSGKTTTIRCLLNFYQADSGQALILGQKYNYNLSNKIGYLPEERGLYTRAGVWELLIYLATLRGIDKNKAEQITEAYLQRVGLAVHKNKKIAQLSSGMQQKVQLGVALVHKPQILILDEPFKGLDPVNRQLYLDIFKELNDQGTTILYSTHVIDEAQKLANRIAIIKSGELKAYGTTMDVRKKYGKDIIRIEYKGKLPVNKDLYTIKSEGQSTQLKMKKPDLSQQILQWLLQNKVEISKFEIDYPSLNEIFIKIVKDE